MNTYLIACCDSEEAWIESVQARSYTSAWDKLITRFSDKYEDLDYPSNYIELKKELKDIGIIIGDLIDIDEI